MATITDLVEDFDGTNGTQLSTGNTIADRLTNGSGAEATFTTAHKMTGTSSAEFAPTSSSRIAEFDLGTPKNVVYLDLYVDVATIPSATTAIVNWWGDTGTSKIGDLRVVPVTGGFQFQLRNVNTALWSSSTLAAAQYRVAVKTDPGSATGHQLRIFSGAGIDSETPTQDSGTQTAVGTAATQVDNVRVGVMTNCTTVVRFDDLTADDAAWPVRAGVGSTGPIAALTETFESGTAPNAITTGTSTFDTMTGTAPTFYATSPYTGTNCMKAATSAATSINHANFTAVDDVWFKLAFRYVTAPGSNNAVCAWYDGATKLADLQLTTAGELRLRDGSTTRWTSTALTANEWHEVMVMVKSSATAKLRCRIYSGAARGGTVASQDSTDVTFSAATTQVGNWRLGGMSSDTMEVHFDVLRGADDAEPDGITPVVTTVPVKVKVGGSWSTATPKTRKAGAWV